MNEIPQTTVGELLTILELPPIVQTKDHTLSGDFEKIRQLSFAILS